MAHRGQWTISAAWIALENYFFDLLVWIGLTVYGLAFAPWS